jgi:hypothetical protein
VLDNKNAPAYEAVKALEAARQVCQATEFRQPQFLDSLAAIYAENRRFREAADTARKAIDLARASGEEPLLNQLTERLKLYERHQSLRQAGARGAPKEIDSGHKITP